MELQIKSYREDNQYYFTENNIILQKRGVHKYGY